MREFLLGWRVSLMKRSWSSHHDLCNVDGSTKKVNSHRYLHVSSIYTFIVIPRKRIYFRSSVQPTICVDTVQRSCVIRLFRHLQSWISHSLTLLNKPIWPKLLKKNRYWLVRHAHFSRVWILYYPVRCKTSYVYTQASWKDASAHVVMTSRVKHCLRKKW